MVERLRSVSVRVVIDTNKQTIDRTFDEPGDAVAFLRECEEEGLIVVDWPDPPVDPPQG